MWCKLGLFLLFLKLCLFQKERDLSLLLDPEHVGVRVEVNFQFYFPHISHLGFPLSPELKLSLTIGDSTMLHIAQL